MHARLTSQRLPAFIVIGAAKAATTWIGHQLRQHPEVFMPTTEPHFFSTHHDKGLGCYVEHFRSAPPGQIVGEKSADYLAHPQAARRIAELVPAVRLVAQLRNPVERAYSDYCMLLRRGMVSDDPARYLGNNDGEMARFLQDGLYHRHLSRYFDHFPGEQVEIILYEDVRDRPETVVASVCRHIGVVPHVDPEAIAMRVNNGKAPLLPLSLRRLLRPIKPVVEPLRGLAWFEAARATLARPMRYPPLTPELRQRLGDFYAADVAALGRLLRRDLTGWLVREPCPQ